MHSLDDHAVRLHAHPLVYRIWVRHCGGHYSGESCYSGISAFFHRFQITSWSQSNKLNINLNKCKELIFKRPSIKNEISITTLSCIDRVDGARLLGVYVDRTLCFREHVEHIARNCKQRFYLLQQIRKQGLNAVCLKILFHSIVLSTILYALSACCLLYTSPSPRDRTRSRMPSSA